MSAHNPYWHCDTSLRGYVCRLLWFWTVYLYLFGVRVKWQYLILSLILSHPVLSITDLIHVSLHLSLILSDVPPTGITVMSHPRGSPRHRLEIELHIMCRSIFWFTIPPTGQSGTSPTSFIPIHGTSRGLYFATEGTSLCHFCLTGGTSRPL